MKQWVGFVFFSPHSCAQRDPTSESVQPLPLQKLAPNFVVLSVFPFPKGGGGRERLRWRTAHLASGDRPAASAGCRRRALALEGLPARLLSVPCPVPGARCSLPGTFI